MKTILSFFILLLISVSMSGQVDFNEKNLEKKLKDIHETTQAAGFSVAIVHGDEVIYEKGYGYSDLENKKKVDEHTLFAIGSTTKAFTTSLLGIMEAEKGLKFSDDPKHYLPTLEFYNDELNNNITIKDMVSHRTGLPRHDFSWYMFPTANKDSLLARVKYQEPFTGLREQWYYNNFMYLAQGMITEKLTGKSWEDNIRTRFFEPLEMTRSNVSIEEMKEQSNVAKGYQLEDFEKNTEMPYYNIAAMGPAGSINSSASDMAQWLKIWVNKGKYNDTQVLPESYVTKAINPLMLVGTGIPDPQFPDQHLNSYGYAWFTSSYKGHYRLEHGGNIDGFTANAAIFPTDSIGIVVLTNQNGSALPTLVRNTIADFILDLEKTDWSKYYGEKITESKAQLKKQKEMEEEEPESVSTPTHNLHDYTGVYSHKGYGNMKLVVENDSLWVQFPKMKAYLGHTHYDIFKPYSVSGGKVTESAMGLNFNFQTNDIGDIASVKVQFEPALDPLVFMRSPNEVKVQLEVLESFAGTYELSGMQLKVSVDDGILKLNVPAQPEYTLTPVSENEFLLKGLTGFKAEFTEKDGVMNLILHQPNGTFVAVRK